MRKERWKKTLYFACSENFLNEDFLDVGVVKFVVSIVRL
jgi:hypothetical protein